MVEDELLREIDEDLRRDKFEKLWREFGKHIIGLSAAVVLATVVIVLWQDHQRSKNTDATTKYLDASFLLSHDKYSEAAEAFEKIRHDASGGVADMAGIRQGQALLGMGENDKALAVFNEVANGHLVDPALRGMAGLLAISAEVKKTGHIPEVSKELLDSKNPFSYTARELQALHLLETGKKDQAAAMLRLLADDEKAPDSLRMRAEMIAGTLGAQQVSK